MSTVRTYLRTYVHLRLLGLHSSGSPYEWLYVSWQSVAVTFGETLGKR